VPPKIQLFAVYKVNLQTSIFKSKGIVSVIPCGVLDVVQLFKKI